MSTMNEFVWTPGDGSDPSARRRLLMHSECPGQPMGQAWFMGAERRMFEELTGDLAGLSVEEIQQPLQEIASGTSAFGPYEEWNEWYHYLLPRLLHRSHDYFVEYTLEYLVTAFIALYPNGIEGEPYAGFGEDALMTIGRAIMDPECWDDSEIVVGRMLCRSDDNLNRVWGWWDASGDFSSSLFFCLKYLPESAIADWFKSVLEIPSPHWRAQLIVWLVGSHDMLTGEIQWPSQLKEHARPSVSWAWSHCLEPSLVMSDDDDYVVLTAMFPRAVGRHLLRAVHEHMTESVYREWLSSISEIPYLETELAEIPTLFERIYLRPN